MATTSISEHSAGVVPFRRDPGGALLYLVIHSATVRNPLAKWEFPKGGIGAGEAPRQAAAREFEEETGISSWAFRGEFERHLSYTYIRDGRRRFKTVVYFLAEVFDVSTMMRSCEHSEDNLGRWYRWGRFLQVLPMLRHVKIRRILTEADAWLRGPAGGEARGEAGSLRGDWTYGPDEVVNTRRGTPETARNVGATAGL